MVSLNEKVEKVAIKLIERHQLKALDSIQLASYLYRKADIRDFIVSDVKLKNAAEAALIKRGHTDSFFYLEYRCTHTHRPRFPCTIPG